MHISGALPGTQEMKHKRYRRVHCMCLVCA